MATAPRKIGRTVLSSDAQRSPKIALPLICGESTASSSCRRQASCAWTTRTIPPCDTEIALTNRGCSMFSNVGMAMLCPWKAARTFYRVRCCSTGQDDRSGPAAVGSAVNNVGRCDARIA